MNGVHQIFRNLILTISAQNSAPAVSKSMIAMTLRQNKHGKCGNSYEDVASNNSARRDGGGGLCEN